MRIRTFAISAVAMPAMLPLLCSAATIYVDDTAPPTGANNGTTWNDAFLDLQDGLKAAQPGDEVRIGQGRYKPAAASGDRTVSFNLPNGAVVQGGYAGFGASGGNPDANDPDQFETILSGDLNDNDGKPGSWVGYEENSYHVVRATNIGPGTELRGVIVRGGNASETQFEGFNNRGGGLFVETGTLTISQCTIEDNQSWFSGGGAEASTLIATDILVRRNRQHSVAGEGAGVWAGPGSSFTDCVFDSNRAGMAAGGGGLFLTDGTVDTCTFIGNHADEQGGALATEGNVNITNSQFASNNCGGAGGAITVGGGSATIADCSFTENSGGDGGAVQAIASATVTISDCEFDDNIAGTGGALDNAGDMAVVRSIFISNSLFIPSNLVGGAINNEGQLDLVNCAFQNNLDGAISNFASLHAVNCRFTNNVAEEHRALLSNSDTATLVNCTIASNQTQVTSDDPESGALHNRAGSQLTVNNCILWANQTADLQSGEAAQISNETGGTVTINNSFIEGWTGAYGGVGNSGEDPQFIDAEDNFRLTEGSPSINAGDNAWLPSDEHDVDEDGDTAETIPLDLDLHARIANGTVDAGAYEFQGAPAGCAADIAPNGGNGTVDTDDLLVVINNWGGSGEGDINNDQAIDVDDLLAVINSWGACE